MNHHLLHQPRRNEAPGVYKRPFHADAVPNPVAIPAKEMPYRVGRLRSGRPRAHTLDLAHLSRVQVWVSIRKQSNARVGRATLSFSDKPLPRSKT